MSADRAVRRLAAGHGVYTEGNYVYGVSRYNRDNVLLPVEEYGWWLVRECDGYGVGPEPCLWCNDELHH
jgi:hypothetical protein